MPIVYLHGVAIRDQNAAPTIAALLEKHVAPTLAPNLDASALRGRIFSAYWGNHAARFAWNRASLPVANATIEDSDDPFPGLALKLLKERTRRAAADDIAAPVGVLSADQLSWVLTAALKDVTSEGASQPSAPSRYADPITALDRAVRDLMPKQGTTEVTGELLDRIAAKASQLLHARGLIDFTLVVAKARDALHARGDDLGLLGSRILLRWRPPINAVLTQFFGDVLVYLTRRGDANAPGNIITDFLDVVLEAANAHPDEPMIVLSHSMGGQIVYDCVTYYIPRIDKYSNLKVDFWVATGSQVPLFEEMKLFKLSDDSIHAPSKVDVSRKHLGYWYNVWDPSDLLSYTADPIFNEVDDEKFESNLPIHTAHFGYLVSPTFYRRLATKLRAARQ